MKYLITLCLAISVATISADVNVVTKSQWNGQEPANQLTALQLPVHRVIICHTATRNCTEKENCSRIVRQIQEYQMKILHYDDVGYNFLIGNDGNIYEGRGWDNQGAHSRGYNADSLGLAFIGTFTEQTPSAAALEAAQQLIADGVRLDRVATYYKLFGHRQVSSTISPGNALYELIKQWPNWSNNIQ